MNFAEFAMASFVLIGLVNGLQFAVDKNWSSFGKFIAAVVAGAFFGYTQWFGLPNIEMGIAIGIASSGAYKVAQKFGGQ